MKLCKCRSCGVESSAEWPDRLALDSRCSDCQAAAWISTCANAKATRSRSDNSKRASPSMAQPLNPKQTRARQQQNCRCCENNAACRKQKQSTHAAGPFVLGKADADLEPAQAKRQPSSPWQAPARIDGRVPKLHCGVCRHKTAARRCSSRHLPLEGAIQEHSRAAALPPRLKRQLPSPRAS